MIRFTFPSRFFCAVCILMAALVLLVAPARATPTFTSLYSFPAINVNDDGGEPSTVVQGSDGNYYGTTTSGGTIGYGTVFKMTPTGTLTTLVDFTGANGAEPSGIIQGSDGNLYGTTSYGGTSSDSAGTVFKLTLSGTLTTLVNFTNMIGEDPNALVQGNDGNFYGTTQYGGATYDGIVFKVTPSGTLTTLVTFDFSNGGLPLGSLIKGSDGNFYGTASFGGTQGLGTIFQVTPTGTLTTLHEFTGAPSDGSAPNVGLTQGSDGSFYGVCSKNGTAGYGTAFKVTSAGVFTTLANFTGTNGTNPNALVQGSDGNFYGTMEAGGSLGEGTAFKLSSSGTLTTLFNFDGTTHGSHPSAPLVQGSDGNLYGTARADGSSGTGVAFKMSTAGTVTPLHVFSDFNDTGGYSYTPLVQGHDGNFYGTTEDGGDFGYGTVFKTTPTGTVTTVYSFSDDLGDGSVPTGLVQGSDGNFYGETKLGGTNGEGTVFKMSPAGTVTILHTFSSVSNGGLRSNGDGANPAGLIQGNDGNFYGTTQGGGASGLGTIYKMTPTGTVTTLVSLTSTGGFEPNTPLVQGTDGNFYGTLGYGGANSNGVIFKVTPAGVFTVLYNFSVDSSGINSDGKNPAAGLVQGTDGNFYGTTHYGGTHGNGTVFKVTPGGILTTLYSFVNQAGTLDRDGANPSANLILASDGNFYGTTSYGGSGSDGTIFSISSSGTLTTLYSFSGSDGFYPNALVQGSDGNFHGTTAFGGSSYVAGSNSGPGTIFQLTGPVPPPTWSARDVAAASDGTARMLWDRSDGAAGIWIMSAADTQTSYGPTYGPYSDSHGTWSAKAISAASDGTTKMLWTKSDGTASVWTLNAAGTQTLTGPSYGPYADSHGTWSAADIAAGPGGTARVLWVKSDGTASVWTMNASDAQSTAGPSYGPYSGWTAKAVGAAGDGTAHILWTNVNRTAGLWTLNASDVETSTGTVYGPYSDTHGTWSAGDMATNADGTSNVLWDRSDGAAGVWTFSASGTQTKVGPVYGPYTGFTAAALDAASDQSRVLWVRSDRAAGLWTFGANDAESVVGSVYGPF